MSIHCQYDRDSRHVPDALFREVSQALMEGSSLTEHQENLGPAAVAAHRQEQDQAQGYQHPLESRPLRQELDWL